MLSTESLNLLWLRFSAEPALAASLRGELSSLFETSAYREWHRSEPREPFSPDGAFPHLESAGLLREGKLQVKVNRIGEKLFVTDGAWVDHVMRVFPDPDEAFVLLDYVKEHGLETWPALVVDTAAGSGHTPLGFPGSVPRVACDVNVRALAYASINGRINGFNATTFATLLNDMKLGFPSHLKPPGNTLFLNNVPFAPSPDDSSLALNSGGGETGADLQAASFRLVEKFHRENRVPVRACFLTWTLGDIRRDHWEVPALCEEIFPGAKIRWTMIQHDYDAPELPNPSPLGPMLDHLAKSQYAVNRENANGNVARFRRLGAKLEAAGYTHIAYGMLDVQLS